MKRLLVLALILPLANCASFSADLTPGNAHAGISLLGTAYSKGVCASIGKTGICTKQDQKTAAKVAAGLNFVIDLWPWWPTQ